MTRLWVITCDRCGNEGPANTSKLEALHDARQLGWRLRYGAGSFDLCPQCYGEKKK